MKPTEIEIQRQYYSNTAGQYDEWHLNQDDEHFFALSFLSGVVDYLQVKSILDIGAGTGRAMVYLKQKKPGIKVVGIEPVRELREMGYKKGLTKNELIDGDATGIKFSDYEFDLVCEFGILHHVRNHNAAVVEMLRVAKKAIFISDSNNFGQGSWLMRTIKQMINLFGLWNGADYLKTRGKGYSISEGDGIAYSYSVFNDYKLIKKHCKSIHILNTGAGGINPYMSNGHIALLGIKR